MMVSFVLSFFPRDVLDEILNLIESVSEDFPSYSFNLITAFAVYFRNASRNVRIIPKLFLLKIVYGVFKCQKHILHPHTTAIILIGQIFGCRKKNKLFV